MGKKYVLHGALVACLLAAGLAHACPATQGLFKSKFRFLAEVVGEETAVVAAADYPAEAGQQLTALRLRVTESRHPEVPVGSEHVMYRAALAPDCSPRAADLTLWHFRSGSLVAIDTDDLVSAKPTSELRRRP